MKNAHVIGLSFLACAFVACGGSTSQSAGESPTTEQTGSAESGGGNTEETAVAGGVEQPLKFPDATPVQVTTLDFGRNGQLLVGFGDGAIAQLKVLDRDGITHQAAARSKQPIAAISSDGSLAVLKSSPTRVVNMKGDLVLNVNVVSNLTSAVFAPNDFSLYISSPDGTIRIWGQAESFQEPSPTEKMEDYLNRQGSDFNIKFKPLAGPLYATSTGHLIITDTEGVLSIWNPRKPSKSKRVMKLDAPIQSVATSGDNIVTTSTKGTLKVGKLDPPSYLPWSRGEKADYAATSDNLFDQFLQLSEGKLAGRVHESGEVLWTRDLPAGKPCGLKVSPNGNLAALCVGNFIAIVSTKDGRLDSIAYRDSSKFWWGDAGGAKILEK